MALVTLGRVAAKQRSGVSGHLISAIIRLISEDSCSLEPLSLKINRMNRINKTELIEHGDWSDTYMQLE